MASGPLSAVICFLHALVVPRADEDGTDRQLLKRFATQRDETAFTALLQRHGPMVSGVCERVRQRLQLLARLIKVGVGARVYYTTQGGYDTHSVQLRPHSNLLLEFSSAVKAFLDDMAAAKLADRVTVLAFSEFGRRVQENGSAGTDHGTAGPVFLAGGGVQPGLVGTTPSLLDLEDGDLKVGLDFRRIYASVLEDWLGLPAKAALGGTFERLALFRG